VNGRIDLVAGQRTLVLIWLVGSTPSLLLVLIRTLGPNAGDIERVWGWLLPTIMPTLSLVVGTYAATAISESTELRTVDVTFFRVSVALSLAYLLIVTAAIAWYPFSATAAILTLERIGVILGPVQGLVSACLGVFFVSQKRDGKNMARRKSAGVQGP
jgi:hypothetical protein